MSLNTHGIKQQDAGTLLIVPFLDKTAYDTLSILFSSTVPPGFCGCALGQERKVFTCVITVLEDWL